MAQLSQSPYFRTLMGTLFAGLLIGTGLLVFGQGVTGWLYLTWPLILFGAWRQKVWKMMGALLLVFTLVAGLLWKVPSLPIVNETIRNQYFHVPLWFAMVALLIGSCWHAGRYLLKSNLKDDAWTSALVGAGTVFGILGILTGMVWAKYTWGRAWHGDPKQIAAAIGLLIYFAYFLLRGSMQDPVRRARLSAVYALFALPIFFALIYVIPRTVPDSMHPGGGGNPGFATYDLDNNMKIVYYPAVLAWFLVGAWISELHKRVTTLTHRHEGLL